MPIPSGTQDRFISEITTGPGSTIRESSVQSDSILVSVFVGSVTSGTLSVVIDTLTTDTHTANIITFPVINSGTANLLLRKSAATMQRFRITATYTGVCDYEVYVRAISSAGEGSTRILGSATWSTEQTIVGTSPTLLIPASLDDRNGIVIKNWSATANVYVAETSAKLLANRSYPLAARDGLALDIAAGAEVWIVSDTASTDVRFAQAGG